jgi:hypothetical protein
MSTVPAEPSATSASRACSSEGPFPKGANGFRSRRRQRKTKRPTARMYRVTDRLHDRRTVEVPCDDIVNTVSAWLAELGAHSSLAEDLARAVCAGDWPTAYAIGDRLSVDVTVAT